MFIGFAFGTLCLIGLAHTFSRRRWHGGFHRYRSYAFGGPHGGCEGSDRPSGFGAYDEFRHHEAPSWGGRGRRRTGGLGRGREVVLSMLARIDATPAQERVILSAVDQLKDVARDLRGTARDARNDVGRAFSGPQIDDAAFESASARLDEAGTKLRAAMRTTIVTIHGVLDDRQRKMVADMVSSRWAF